MDRQQLIGAIVAKDKNALSKLVMEKGPRKTIYFLVCEPGGPEYLQLSDIDQGKRQIQWNPQGRYFDENGVDHPASELRGCQFVDKSLKCFYVNELPFKVDCGEGVKFAFRGEVVEIYHGAE